jgi:predicted nucleotidyltransferase
MIDIEQIDLTGSQLNIILALLSQHVPDRAVRAFGSRVRHTSLPQSDLDLVVIGREKLALEDLGNLRDSFEDSPLPFTVDLLDWHRLTDAIRQGILKTSVEIQPAADHDADSG